MTPDPTAPRSGPGDVAGRDDVAGRGGSGIAVELDALLADARSWHAAADELVLRANHAAGLIVPTAPFSSWAIDAGFPGLYEQARAHIEALLHQGSGHFEAIAVTLSQAAETYRREDAQGAHRFGAG